MTTVQVSQVTAGYGELTVLHDVDVELGTGITVILGGNGAGKSTLLKTIVGLVRPRSGTVHLGSRDITRARCHELARHGVRLMLQGHPVVTSLSVEDNVRLGQEHRRGHRAEPPSVEAVFEQFPALGRRRQVSAAALSGGERALLAMARVLVAAPDVVLMDEPSVGLSPVARRDLSAAIESVRDAGTTIGIVEQNAEWALGLGDQGVVLQNGRIVLRGTAEDLTEDDRVIAAYLGRS